MQPHMLRADARASRARILDAAHALLRERGLDVEVKEIAERAGVGIGTLYRHFPTKDDLILGIAGEMFGVFQQILDDALAVNDPIAAISFWLRHALETVDRYGDLVEMLHRSGLSPRKEQFDIDGLLLRLMAIVQKGIDRGVYRPDLDTELAATLLVGSLHPPIMQMLRRKQSLDEIIEQRLALFLWGVCRPEAQAAEA